MASDAGSGGAGPSLGWPFGGIVEAVQDTVGDLVTELQSFTKFRDRIDEILRNLKESPADAKKLGEVSIGKSQFGDSKWTEASLLFSSYREVVTELETLSKLLSDSIEGMGIAVLAAHNGYENLDDDIRDRMLAIRRGTQEHYDGDYNPVPGEGKPDAGQPTSAKRGDGDTAGIGGLSWDK
ncbi:MULTISPECIES: hypothetical protein [Streptomyces]|uniref:Uncharacterized protein n=1 Tax=Streptomyces flavovirens TaxID=52258 RepID=A0ABV8N7C0_9ACTN|nr:hypothetical protein [Streptomyces sp. MBT51]MBK3593165.1 hypothetical protein [Streptomyces sp. MBT51]